MVNHGRRIIVTNIHCVPAVETAGYVLLLCVVFQYSQWFQPRGRIIVADIHRVPAVETAGYVLLLFVVFQYNPWFQPRGTYR